MNYISTHEELLKLHGRKVSCEIEYKKILDAKICVEYYFIDNIHIHGYNNESLFPRIYICQNKLQGEMTSNLLGYNRSWFISNPKLLYEKNHQSCYKILLEDPQLELDF